MTDDYDLLSDEATVVRWDDPEGIGEAVTDAAGHRVWLHYSMHPPEFGNDIFAEGARLRITYRATEDQDGYAWLGLECSPVSAKK